MPMYLSISTSVWVSVFLCFSVSVSVGWSGCVSRCLCICLWEYLSDSGVSLCYYVATFLCVSLGLSGDVSVFLGVPVKPQGPLLSRCWIPLYPGVATVLLLTSPQAPFWLHASVSSPAQSRCSASDLHLNPSICPSQLLGTVRVDDW